ncbi:hypothetical protein F5Y18DRAFT_432144 [Xylariaceae sp. FL1019]|nr:hypothetical protein F5Y18DRAFT_432144 [Xylariaceae sp. FL1019]
MLTSAAGGSVVDTKLLDELDQILLKQMLLRGVLRLSLAQFRALGQAGQQYLRQLSSAFPSGATEFFLDSTDSKTVFLAVPNDLENVYGRYIDTPTQGLRSLSDRVKPDARFPNENGGRRPEERVPPDFLPYEYVKQADSAFTCFRRVYDREDIVRKEQGQSHMAAVAEMWKNLDKQEKDDFVDDADISKAEREEMLQYKEILCIPNIKPT